MAKEKNNIFNKADEFASKSSAFVYGTDSDLEKETNQLSRIVSATINDTASRYISDPNGKVISHFTNQAVSQIYDSPSDMPIAEDKEAAKDALDRFKTAMETNAEAAAAQLAAGGNRKRAAYATYRSIPENIAECAQVGDTYKTNIISPDDFSNKIFNIDYEDNSAEKIKDEVIEKAKKLVTKYDIERRTGEYIEEALTLGDCYVAVLSVNEELDKMLLDKEGDSRSAKIMGNLTESLFQNEDTIEYLELNESDISITESENRYMNSFFEVDKTPSDAKKFVANCINENIIIGNPSSYLEEYVLAERHEHALNEARLNEAYSKKARNYGRVRKGRDLLLNGSYIMKLNPDNVIDLSIDGNSYGYYYIEELDFGADVGNYNANYLGVPTKNVIQNTPSDSTLGAVSHKVEEENIEFEKEKMLYIANVFADALGKKVDREYIKHNKEFKDVIFSLMRNDYIIKRKVKITYFAPEDVIHFEVPSIYRKVTLYAQLYVSQLLNHMNIALARGHDKRMYFVAMGLDTNIEQAMTQTIQNVKSKEYALSSIRDINTTLQQGYGGRMDDIFLPMFNGERQIEIDTLAGMDQNMSTELMEFLRNGILVGMDVPKGLIDETADVEYAKMITSRNGAFVNTIITYQKLLEIPFTQFIQRLFRNEYRYYNGKEVGLDNKVRLDALVTRFQRPKALMFANIQQQIGEIETIAETVAFVQFPLDDEEEIAKRTIMKALVIKDSLPTLDWSIYEKMAKKDVEEVFNRIQLKKKKPDGTNEGDDDNNDSGGWR